MKRDDSAYQVFSGQIKSTFALAPSISRIIEGHAGYPFNFEKTMSPTLNSIVQICMDFVHV